MKSYEVHIPLKRGKQVSLFLTPSKEDDIVEDVNGVVPFQLIEGKRYYFELDDPNYFIDGDKQIITIFSSRSGLSNGTLTTGNYVGTFSADVRQKSNNEKVGQFDIEIRSTKIGYEDDYRKMMEDITEFCSELLMQQSSPVTQNYIIDQDSNPMTQYERFAFVKSLIESDSFDDAISQVEMQPITKWEDTEEERSVENIRHLSSRGLRQIAASKRRIELSSSDPTYSLMHSIPEVIKVQSRRDTTDVAENRFIKFVLDSFLGFCLSVRNNPYAQERLKNEADEVCQKLFQYLAHPLFRNIGRLTTMPLGSPALQKRGGYREILQKWLMFDMAAKLTWDGGDDVYSAGQKNVARLYEYWLFFKLLNEFSRKFNIQPIEKSKLIQKTEGNLSLALKEGRMQVMNGTYSFKGRKLNMAFAYNRTFKYTQEYEKPGSWSQQMRPDYTLSVWPGDIDSAEYAETQDLITHIHFDAKYRIENLIREFNKENDEDLTSIKHEEELGTYKRADLLKMHAYKDAIKRSAGAYVLYPGSSNPDPFQNFHEIIPGLGAFAISPRDNNISCFLKFIDDVIENFLNRTSQRERMQHHRYMDLQIPLSENYASLPEPTGNARVMPDDTYVIIGYTHQNKTDWVEEHKLYPARIGLKTKGSIFFNKELVSAKYLLSYNRHSQRLYRIDDSKGPLIVSREDIEAAPYCYSKPKHDHYFLFKLLDAEIEFNDLIFKIEELDNYNSNKQLFVVKLTELMRHVIKD